MNGEICFLCERPMGNSTCMINGKPAHLRCRGHGNPNAPAHMNYKNPSDEAEERWHSVHTEDFLECDDCAGSYTKGIQRDEKQKTLATLEENIQSLVTDELEGFPQNTQFILGLERALEEIAKMKEE